MDSQKIIKSGQPSEIEDEVTSGLSYESKSKIYFALFLVFFVLFLGAVATSVYLVTTRPKVTTSETSLEHLVGVHTPDCTGTLYTLNVSLPTGSVLFNITDVPDCFLSANPHFPASGEGRLLPANEGRLLQEWQWVWDPAQQIYIYVLVDKVKFELHLALPIVLFMILFLV